MEALLVSRGADGYGVCIRARSRSRGAGHHWLHGPVDIGFLPGHFLDISTCRFRVIPRDSNRTISSLLSRSRTTTQYIPYGSLMDGPACSTTRYHSSQSQLTISRCHRRTRPSGFMRNVSSGPLSPIEVEDALYSPKTGSNLRS